MRGGAAGAGDSFLLLQHQLSVIQVVAFLLVRLCCFIGFCSRFLSGLEAEDLQNVVVRQGLFLLRLLRSRERRFRWRGKLGDPTGEELVSKIAELRKFSKSKFQSESVKFNKSRLLFIRVTVAREKCKL